MNNWPMGGIAGSKLELRMNQREQAPHDA